MSKFEDLAILPPRTLENNWNALGSRFPPPPAYEFPRDKERLFMPPVPSLIIASIVFSIFFFIMKEQTYLFFPGFVSGYLIYGSMHYAIHAMAPPFRFMKSWWRYHHLHHYKSPDKGFGVSSPFWDHIFRTVPRYEGKFDNPEESLS